MGNMLTEIGLYHYLALSSLMFVLGLVVIMTRRNAIGVLMGLELILNAAGINFVAFNKYSAPDRLDGQIFVIFVIILAAAEAATALATRAERVPPHEVNQRGRPARVMKG